MLNYGIFGCTQSTAIYADILRSHGYPIVAFGALNSTKEKAIVTSCMRSLDTRVSERNNSTQHSSLWSMIQQEDIACVILGGEGSLRELKKCLESRNTYQHQTASRNFSSKIIALDTLSIDTDTLTMLDDIILQYENLTTSTKNHDCFPKILVYPMFFMRYDSVLQYASALRPASTGQIDFLTIAHTSFIEPFSSTMPLNQCLHVVDLLRILHDDPPAIIESCTNGGEDASILSTNFTTSRGVLGSLSIARSHFVENLFLSFSGGKGAAFCGLGRKRPGHTPVHVWSRKIKYEKLSRSLWFQKPRLTFENRSPMEIRWSEAVQRFFMSVQPGHKTFQEMLVKSYRSLLDLKKTLKLAKTLFLQ